MTGLSPARAAQRKVNYHTRTTLKQFFTDPKLAAKIADDVLDDQPVSSRVVESRLLQIARCLTTAAGLVVKRCEEA